MKTLTSAILIMLLVPISSVAWEATCVNVENGNTIQVLYPEFACMVGKDGNVPIPIRLWGIDCPEKKSSGYATKAKAFTEQLVKDKLVEVTLKGPRRFGQFVAIVKVDGKNVAHDLLRTGLAWWNRKSAPHNATHAHLEFEAQKKRVGIWSLSEPEEGIPIPFPVGKRFPLR